MILKAWPFLVTRNKVVDYKTVVAPDFLFDLKVTNILASAAGGEQSSPGIAFYKEILDSRFKKIALIYIFSEAKNINGKPLTDALGRTFDRIEGWVFNESVDLSSINAETIALASKLVESSFRKFWDNGDSSLIYKSKLTPLKKLDGTNRYEIKKLEPFITDTSHEKLGTSANIRNSDDGATSVDVDLKIKKPKGKQTIRIPESAVSAKSKKKYTWEHLERKRFRVKEPVHDLVLIDSTPIIVVLHKDKRHLSIVDLHKHKELHYGELKNKSQKHGGISVINSHKLAIVDNPSLLNKGAKVWFYDLNTEFQQDTATINEIISALVYAQKSNKLVCATADGSIYFWDDEKGSWNQKIKVFDNQISTLAFSGDEKYLAVSGRQGGLAIIDLSKPLDNEILWRSKGFQINSVSVNTEGTLVAAAGNDSEIIVWSVPGFTELIRIKANCGPINSIAFSPKDDLLAIGAADKSVRVWSVPEWEWEETFIVQNGEVKCVLFTNDSGTLISGSDDSVINVWNLKKNVD